jgi:arylsulfatase A-like enzyme
MRAVVAAAALLAIGSTVYFLARDGVDQREGDVNVVLIVVDTLRPDHLTHYGYSLGTSEPVEVLFDHSAVFEDCRAPSGWTVPSTSTIMTGMNPLAHRVRKLGDVLDENLETVAEVLSNKGYTTIGVSHNTSVSRAAGFAQGFDHFFDYQGQNVLAYPDISKAIEPLIEWLHNKDDGAFFIYLQPMNCHGPYRTPSPNRDDLLGRPPRQGFAYYDELMKSLMWRGDTARRAEVTEERIASLVEQYDTAIHYSMTQIRRLLDCLIDLGLWGDTLVILTSDHGEELFDHGGFSHAYSLYEEVLKVPLLIKLPGQESSRRVSGRVSLADILPTVADVIGVPAPRRAFGMSLRSRTRGEPAGEEENRTLTFESSWKKRFAGTGILRGRYKLIRVERNYEGLRNADLLFDLVDDPGEIRDISSAHAELVGQLSRALREEVEAFAKSGVGDAGNILDRMNTEALRALGYIEDEDEGENGDGDGDGGGGER